MEAWRPDWRSLIDDGGAVEDPSIAITQTDEAIFEAFAVALLSGNTRWDRIARVRHELRTPFQGYDLRKFAALSEEEIAQSIVPWFRERKAGAPGLAAALTRLRQTAARLSDYRGAPHAAQGFLRDAFHDSDGSPEGFAITLGTSGTWKLPGFGIALAAEALRMLGLDLCKPDRHVLRAAASWSLVDFRRWDQPSDYSAPSADTGELRATMLAVRSIGDANEASVSYANSVIWTAGAVSGARLTNAEFAAIGEACAPARR
jgi:endonuclease III